jgi:hypothetical protein
MSAASWDPVIEQNVTFKRTITWEDDDGPVDPTGWTASMQIRDPDGTLLVDFTDYITIDTVAKTLVLNVPVSVTKDLTFKNADYDLRLVHPDGPEVEAIRLLKGKASVSEGMSV